MSANDGHRMSSGRRAVMAVCVVAAAAYAAIGIGRGSYGSAAVGALIMLGYAALLTVLRHRSETAGLLGGAAEDERQQHIVLRASAASGQLLVAVLVVAMLVAVATGSSTAALLSGLCAVSGFSFVAFTWWYSRHA